MDKQNFFIKRIVSLLFCNIFIPFFLYSNVDFVDSLSQPEQLKINIIAQSNGKGLETDQKILKEALEQLGHLVVLVNFKDLARKQADINIFFQALVPEKLKWARLNWFIPNPEWYDRDIKLLEKIDLILCRTKEVERIFRDLNKQTYYLGFTSPDCYQQEIQKNFSHLFHLAGGSHFKGTAAIQNIWLSHVSFPLLTVINFSNNFNSQQSNLEWVHCRLPQTELRQLQNECGIHLCPSETEGFGHYIIEAMSTGAVVVTTDAPPMNEFIKDKRCLVPYHRSDSIYLATKYYVDPIELENKIKYLIDLPDDELLSIGLKNRSIYLEQKQEFYEKLEELLWVVSFYFDKSIAK